VTCLFWAALLEGPRSGLALDPNRSLTQYTHESWMSRDGLPRTSDRLDGFDAGWVEAAARRAACYTNLLPGRYRFRVTAGNEDGPWSEEGASRPFEVEAFLDQTPWFYALCVMTLAAGVWGAYRIRSQALVARNAVLAERARIARDIHDTLAQRLTAIVLQLQAAECRVAGSPAALPVKRAQELARGTLKEAQRTIHVMRQEEHGPTPLAEALGRFLDWMTAGTEVRATLEILGRPRRLSPGAQEELLRIAQEAFTNALRHSGSREVRVSVRWGWRRVRIEVSDRGCGFAAPSEATRAATPGLRGMAERAAALKAKLTIDTRPGEGAVVAVEAPVAFWRGGGLI